MNKATPFRCHDADACALGQKPCPTPEACGSAPDYIALAHASGAATYIPSHGARGLTFTFAQLGDFVARVQAAQAQDVQHDSDAVMHVQALTLALNRVLHPAMVDEFNRAYGMLKQDAAIAASAAKGA